MKSRKRFKRTAAYIILSVCGFIMVFPFLWMVATSFKVGSEIYSMSLIPKHFSIANYKKILGASPFLLWFWNSFLVSGITTASVLIFDPLVGYVFSKYHFRGKELIFLLILSTLMIPTEMMIIPWYLSVVKLRLTNTLFSLLFPGLMSAFGIFMMRQFFTGVPTDLLDAGRIDGLSELAIYRKIALPLVKPALSALGIFTFLGCWNSFLWPVIVLNDKSMYTITVGVAQFSSEMLNQWDLIMTSASIATLPVLVIFLIFQKQIIEGIQLTGVKG